MSVRPAVVLDLDGTLLDTSARYYAVYQLIAESLQIHPLAFSGYWRKRRCGLSNIEVLMQQGLPVKDRTQAEEIWLRLIESPEMLKKDRLFPGVGRWLKTWNGKVAFVLATMRSDELAAKAQLTELGLSGCFRRILVLRHKTDPVAVKANAVSGIKCEKIFAWIGDSEVDMRAARRIGAQALGVTSGIRNVEVLLSAGATEVFKLVTNIQIKPDYGGGSLRI